MTFGTWQRPRAVIRNLMFRLLVYVGLMIALWPGAAEAQGLPPAAPVVMIAAAAPELVFLTFDVLWLALDEEVPYAISIPELIWGLGLTTFGIAGAIGEIYQMDSGQSALFVGTGLWHLIYGAVRIATRATLPTVGVSPTDQGFQLNLSGRF